MAKRKLIKRMPISAKRAAGVISGNMQAPSFMQSAYYPSLAGIYVSPETALTFTAVYAAIRILSEDIASFPLEVFRKNAASGSTTVPDHPVYQRLAISPNGETTDFNWRESQASHVLGWGNAYAELEWSKSGEILGMHLMHPSHTEAFRKSDGKLSYKSRRADGTEVVLPSENVWHLSGLGFNGVTGYSPVALAREAIGLGKAAEQFGSSFFGNSARPSGMLKYPGRLSTDAMKRVREDWNSIHQGSANANNVAILEEGMEWVQTQIAPEDAQFLATRQFQVVEIGRIYRLPPHKLGDFTHAHLTNIEASNFDYLITCLRPWLVRIEKSANLKLFSEAERKAGFYVKHDMRALLRAASKDRAEYYQKMQAMGAYDLDEIRSLEDLNPIGEKAGGNLRFIPVNYTTLEAMKQGGPAVMIAQAEGGGNNGGGEPASDEAKPGDAAPNQSPKGAAKK